MWIFDADALLTYLITEDAKLKKCMQQKQFLFQIIKRNHLSLPHAALSALLRTISQFPENPPPRKFFPHRTDVFSPLFRLTHLP
jgi:hypothetical protein